MKNDFSLNRVYLVSASRKLKMDIIDNSLCNIDFSENATADTVKDYILSLFKSGVDYAEIDSSAIKYLYDINTSERFIFRIENIEDFEIISKKRFKYLVLPLNMIAVAQKLQPLKIMIEVNCTGYDYNALCHIKKKISELGCAACIRLKADFPTNDSFLEEFLENNFGENYFPIDVCPLNSSLRGIDAAYTATWSNSDMITLGFGSSYLYTPYEMYFLYQSGDLSQLNNPLKIPFLYAASACLNSISNSYNHALDNLEIIMRESEKITGIVDSGEMKGNIRPIEIHQMRPKRPNFTKAQMSFFENNSIFTKEERNSIAEAVDNADLSLYDRFNENKGIKQ